MDAGLVRGIIRIHPEALSTIHRLTGSLQLSLKDLATFSIKV